VLSTATMQLHWWPKIQVSGTGLALVSSFAPTLGISVPYFIRLAAVVVVLLRIVWPLLDYAFDRFRWVRKMWLLLGMTAGALLFVV
jgi:hypothetical protein